MKRAVFIDRDGVICKEKNLFYNGNYITKPEDFEWEINAREGLEKLCKLENFLLILVTGQSAINKGLFSIEMFHKINKQIYEELAKHNKKFDGVYFCPHLKEENCVCRKPKIGMLLRAKRELKIDLTESYVIEDKLRGIKMGINAGCKTILVRTGYGGRDREFNVKPDFVVKDLYEAIGMIK